VEIHPGALERFILGGENAPICDNEEGRAGSGGKKVNHGILSGIPLSEASASQEKV